MEFVSMAEANDYISTSLAADDAAVADAGPAPVETPAPDSAPDAPGAPDDLEPQDDDQPDDQPVSKHNLDRRFRRLTGRIRERDQEITRLQTQVDTLLRTQAPAPAAEPAVPEPSAPVRPEDYPDYDAYVQALVDRRAQQLIEDRFRQQEQTATAERERAAQEAQAQAYAARVEAAKQRYPDYDDVLEEATFPVSPALLEELRTSELGPDLAYHLAQHPDEATRLSQLPPRALARELGKLEGQIQAGTTPNATPNATSAPSPRPAVPTRPRPLTPVAGAQGTSTTPVFDPATASFEEYKRWRAQGGGRG